MDVLKQREKRLENQKKAQAKYREQLKAKKGEDYKKEQAEYMKEYRKNNKDILNKKNTEYMKQYRQQQRIAEQKALHELNKEQETIKDVAVNIIKKNIKMKLAVNKLKEIKEEPKKTIELKPIKKGRVKKQDTDITPSYIKYPDAKLEASTIETYIRRLKKTYTLTTKKEIDETTIIECRKMLEGKEYNKSLIEKIIKKFKDINKVIEILREEYQEDNTFRNYINILSVFLGRFKKYNKEYQQVAKINFELNEKYNEKRNEHKLEEKDEGKIFNFTEEDIKDKITKIKDITEKVIYVLSIYLPRRLEIRKLKLAKENDNEKNNYLIVDENNIASEAIFKEYKTKSNYKEQIDKIPENIKEIIKEYLDTKKIKIGEYILGQKDKKKEIDQSNFTKKVKKIFTDLYGVEITNKWVRHSRITHQDGSYLEAKRIFEENAIKSGHSVVVHEQYIKK